MRIKQLILEKGITAKALAASTGLTEMGLSKIITGKSSPNADTIVKIASALGVSCGSLFDDYDMPVSDFIAFIRDNGRTYEAHSIEELENIINKLKDTDL